MQGMRTSNETNEVTALAASRAGVSTGSPGDARAAVRRITGTWHQPEPWTVAVLLLTGVVIIARHPLSRTLGTEVEEPPVAPATVATVMATHEPVTAPAAAA